MPKGKGSLGIAAAVESDAKPVKPVIKRETKDHVQMSFTFSKDIRKALRIAAAENEVSMSEFVEDLIRAKLGM